MVKNLPANAGDIRDVGSIPGQGRSPGGEHGDSLQYSCLENSMDRKAWQAMIHGGCKESDMTEQVTQLRVWIWGKNSLVAQLVKNLPAVQETWV